MAGVGSFMFLQEELEDDILEKAGIRKLWDPLELGYGLRPRARRRRVYYNRRGLVHRFQFGVRVYSRPDGRHQEGTEHHWWDLHGRQRWSERLGCAADNRKWRPGCDGFFFRHVGCIG